MSDLTLKLDPTEDAMYDDYTEIIDEFGSAALEDWLVTDDEDDSTGKDSTADPYRLIRVEKHADGALQGIRTVGDVYARIDEARRQQSEAGPEASTRNTSLSSSPWNHQGRRLQDLRGLRGKEE